MGKRDKKIVLIIEAERGHPQPWQRHLGGFDWMIKRHESDVLFTLLWYGVFQHGCGCVLLGLAESNCGPFVTQARVLCSSK